MKTQNYKCEVGMLLVCFVMLAVNYLVPTPLLATHFQQDGSSRTGHSLLDRSDQKSQPDERASAITRIGELTAKAFAEQELKIERPEIIAFSSNVTPTSNQLVFSAKILDAEGNIHGALLDSRGRELPADLLIKEEDFTYQRKGRIHPDLQDRLLQAHRDDQIPVVIWVRTPDELPLPELPHPKQPVDKEANDKLQRDISAIAAIRDKFHTVEIAEKLIDKGLDVYIVDDAPLIQTKLHPDMIREIAADDDVLEVYTDSINFPEMNMARRVVRADIVNNQGITGAGVRVGVIEVGGRVNLNNPFLSVPMQQMTNTSLSSHTSSVTGVLASRHSTHRGIAPAVDLFIGGSALGLDSELQASMNSARNWGARVLNTSWGSNDTSRVPNGMARFLDNLVLQHRMTVVKSAGNRGQMASPNITNPGNFYNGITVGAYNDQNTFVTSDDVMARLSSFLNPISTNGDRVKPEVVAPGVSIISLSNSSPWLDGGNSGTSLAAPVVSGIAALLMQRQPSLQHWPEVVKSIIMATALHNIEGDSRLSNFDGAGGVLADRADDVARGVQYSGFGGSLYTDFHPTNFNIAKMQLVAGRRTRVVIAWSNHPNYSGYERRPSADLDLVVVRSSGVVVARSASFDNTYEIVDFVPALSGEYTIRVHKHRFSGPNTYLGFAWYQVP